VQPQMTGMSGMGMGGMGMQPQMTGMSGMQQMQPQVTGMQSMQPQMTGMQFGGFGNNGMAVNRGLPSPLVPQRTAAPTLIPQPTGPAPTVRFGVQKLTPQPTGKANLNKASKYPVPVFQVKRGFARRSRRKSLAKRASSGEMEWKNDANDNSFSSG
jgi:hypothetical protein